MTSRKTLVAANWKENPLPEGWSDKESAYRSAQHADVVVFPMDGDIPACIAQGLVVGSQWVGSRSMMHLKDVGCTYVLCGHSDRRNSKGETDQDVAEQVKDAVNAGLIPILCVGETKKERDADVQFGVVRRQITAVDPIPPSLIIAYEPMWAIGAGTADDPHAVATMNQFIRELCPANRIMYGASVNAANAADLIIIARAEGLLVGGASLDPKGFRQIVDACAQ